MQAAQKAHVEMTKKMRQNLEKDMAVEEEEYGKAAAAKGAGTFSFAIWGRGEGVRRTWLCRRRSTARPPPPRGRVR